MTAYISRIRAERAVSRQTQTSDTLTHTYNSSHATALHTHSTASDDAVLSVLCCVFALLWGGFFCRHTAVPACQQPAQFCGWTKVRSAVRPQIRKFGLPGSGSTSWYWNCRQIRNSTTGRNNRRILLFYYYSYKTSKNKQVSTRFVIVEV